MKPLWPTHCLLCCEITPNAALCEGCLNELPWLMDNCYQCGLPFEKPAFPTTRCGACVTQPPPFEKTIALFQYQSPITHFISQLKFNHRLLYAHLLGTLLSKKIDTSPDCIIPIPLHYKRLRQRGFNQSVEIARPIAKKRNIPINIDAFVRCKNTQPQATLPARDRAFNIKKAFKQQKPFTAKHVAIIDDVMTTGNTITEFSKLLKRSGVAHIEAWCCARAISPSHTAPQKVII